MKQFLFFLTLVIAESSSSSFGLISTNWGEREVPSPPVWPADFSAWTNVTMTGRPTDTGTIWYNWGMRAQLSVHSALFPYAAAGVGLWLNKTYFFISDNYQSCCVDQSQAGLSVPTPDWPSNFTFSKVVAMYGVDCFEWNNSALADSVYYESVAERLPVLWRASYGAQPTYQVFRNVRPGAAADPGLFARLLTRNEFVYKFRCGDWMLLYVFILYAQISNKQIIS